MYNETVGTDSKTLAERTQGCAPLLRLDVSYVLSKLPAFAACLKWHHWELLWNLSRICREMLPASLEIALEETGFALLTILCLQASHMYIIHSLEN